MNRSFVIGDIHGAHLALLQCFRKAGFDPQADRLICLGDATDGWPEVREVMEELMHVRNLVYILGNHDQWFLEWARTGMAPAIWLMQGGQAALDAYPDGVPEGHLQLLNRAVYYHTENDRLFIHGGFDPLQPLEHQDRQVFLWDRSLVQHAMDLREEGEEKQISAFREVFLGHTPTISYGVDRPVKACELRLMDTGAGWSGTLSMMDINTGEIYQSEPVFRLYPGVRGRM